MAIPRTDMDGHQEQLHDKHFSLTSEEERHVIDTQQDSPLEYKLCY